MSTKPTYKELEEELTFLKATNDLIIKSPKVRFIWKNQKNWPVEYVSENAENIFGYSADDFAENKIVYSEIIFPDDLPRVENEVNSHSKTGSYSIEHEPYRIISKSGEIKWLNDITLIRRNENNEITHFEGIIFEITERKKAEQIINRQSASITQSPSIVVMTNPKGDIIYANPSFEKSTGYTLYEAVGKNPRILKSGKHSGKFYKEIWETVKKGKHWQGELYNRKKDGTYYWELANIFPIYDEGGKLVNFIKTSEDITDRKQAEIELQESEDRLSKTLMVANDGMWDWNLITNKVYFDPRYYEMAGYVTDEFPYELEEFQKRIHPDDVENVMVQVQQHLKGKIARFNVEFRFKKKSGDWLWLIGRGQIVERDKNNKPLRFIGTHTDITKRKKAELALKESEEKFQTIVDFTYDWQYWLSPQDEIIYISPSCERITGYSPNEFMETPELLTSIVHPDDVKNWKSHKHNAFDKAEIETVEFRIITKKGKERWIGHVCQTVNNSNGVNIGIRGSNRDITERKLVESALRESEELFSLFMDSATDKFTLWSSNLHLLKINRIALSLFPKGTKTADLIGKNLLELFPKIKKTGQYDKYLEVIKTGIPFNIDEYIPDTGKGNKHFSLRAFKAGNGVGIITTDITERKNIENALKRSEYVLNETQRISKIGGWEYDVESGETYFSDEVFTIYGLPNDKMFKAEEGIKFYHPDDLQLVSDSFSKAISDGVPYDIEVRFINTRGENMWVNTAGKPISENGKIVRILGTLWDITDRKLAEQALKESESKLRESNQAKDKFFSIIAHDLKSPFNTMLGFSEILNDKFDEFSSEKKKKFIGVIYKGLQNTFKLLENLLHWSQSQNGIIHFNPEEINLYLIVKEITDLSNQSAETKSIQLINQIDENVFVVADRDLLATIIRNLLSNAIKYTHKSGEITIKTFLEPDEKSNKKHSQFVGISVIDTGVGIPKEIQSKLFDIGENTSTKGTESETGTGLGLVLCKEFIEKHGGKIWVESKVDKGSSFCFTIPRK